MSKVRASIFSGALPHTAEVVGMNKVQVDHIELAPVGNHLLDELAQGVQEHNRPERLGHGIGGLAGFGNHHRHTVLKMPRPNDLPEGRHFASADVHVWNRLPTAPLPGTTPLYSVVQAKTRHLSLQGVWVHCLCLYPAR